MIISLWCHFPMSDLNSIAQRLHTVAVTDRGSKQRHSIFLFVFFTPLSHLEYETCFSRGFRVSFVYSLICFAAARIQTVDRL